MASASSPQQSASGYPQGVEDGKLAHTTTAPTLHTNPTDPTHGADAALKLLKETGGLHQPANPEASKRLLRKIDLHIMPLICIVYFLQYIDKTAISYASVTGIIESTGLHGNQFNWVASIFFFGYVVGNP